MATDTTSTFLRIRRNPADLALDLRSGARWEATRVGRERRLAMAACTGDCLFFAQPLEIRQEIFYMALLIQANMISSLPHKNTFELHLDVYKIALLRTGIRKIYWGTEGSSNLFPICRQWYTEIQEVLYSRYIFKFTQGLILEMPEAVLPSLSFLPAVAFTHIRCITLQMALPWNSIEPKTREKLRETYENLSASLPNLKAIKFEIIHDWQDKAEGIQMKNRGEVLVLSSMRSTVIETMLSFFRPFKHLVEIIFRAENALTNILYHPRPEEGRGTPFENLVLECIRILEEEIKAECVGNGRVLPRIELWPRITGAVWKDEYYESSWSHRHQYYHEDFLKLGPVEVEET